MPDSNLRNLLIATPGAPSATKAGAHVRDAISVNMLMRLLVLATIPCILAGMLNAGYQANIAMAMLELDAIPNWRGPVLELMGVDYRAASIWDNFSHGAAYFLPLLVVTLAVTLTWEQLFARLRGREVVEGALATAILFTLTLPPTLPLWQAALGISFGVVLAREVFGGTGMNIVHPVLAGRAFLYFAYPEQITSDVIWTAVDGVSGATMLASAKTAGLPALLVSDRAWFNAFIGKLPGALGETSTLACLIGGSIMLICGVISWRIVIASVIGLVVATWLFNMISSDTNPMFALPWHCHLVLGGFAFGVIFLATDPVTSPVTNVGRWLYGALIGLLTVIIRVTNPAIPEGVMFAVLLASIFAPTFDHLVIRANIKRRARRLASVPAP
ncbi:MAG: NADH:ubiquinone reductase (Na(+)-transporting) subunit B [Gammaproteobacteria bacterium]